MAEELATLRKRLLAPRADVWAIPSVCSFVLLQAALQAERLPAFTRERASASVDLPVGNQVASRRKLPTTVFTSVGLLASMRSEMGLKSAALCENLIAMSTSKWLVSAMGSDVFPKSSLLRKGLSAFFAFIGLFRHMHSHVSLQISRASESFATIANKWLISRMTPRMNLESISPFENFPALSARLQFFFIKIGQVRGRNWKVIAFLH
jgi:hypothetical protein